MSEEKLTMKTWRQKMRHDQASVSVYPDPNVAREAVQMDLALALLPADDPAAAPLKERLDRLKAEASETELKFVFRGLTDKEYEELMKKANQANSDDLAQLKLQTVKVYLGGQETEMSDEDWVEIMSGIDVSQSSAVWRTANGLLQDQPSMPDF